MSSEINNQVVAVQRFSIPVGTGIANNTSPSLTATSGSIAYDTTTAGVLYIGDGTLWKGTSGSTDNPVFGSITLATTGGIATALNYYEEGVIIVNWTGGITATEPFTFTRIGKIVTIRGANLQSTALSTEPIVAVGALPTKLTPLNSIPVNFTIPVVNNSAIPATPGLLIVGSNSQLSLFLNMSSAVFAGTGLCGHGAFAVTYNIN